MGPGGEDELHPVRLRKGQMREGQRIESIATQGDVVVFTGPDVEFRFPSGWAKKLLLWAEGPARNIVCNADLTRFNLQGVTKVGEDLVFSYVGPKWSLEAERMSRGFLPVLKDLLKGGKTGYDINVL